MRHYLFLAIVLVLISCGSEQTVPNGPALGFYYWRTEFNPSPAEKQVLEQTECKRLYTRLFDLECGYNEDERYMLEPAGRLVNREPFDSLIEIVPVVYITECAVSRMSMAEEREKYAALMLGKINRILHRHGANPPKEYQLDCDWTETTRENYFEFIKVVKEKVKPAIVSVTLRLYPYKYRTKAGVPPAHRVMLMYYNMGEFNSVKDRSAVLDNVEGKKYLKGIPTYPLPMDFALPLYTQARKISVSKYSAQPYLMELFSLEKLKDITKEPSVIKVGKQRWGVVEYLDNDKRNEKLQNQGYYGSMSGLDYTHVLVSDNYSLEDLKEAGALLAKCINTQDYHVVFYHLDDTFTNKYKANELEEITALIR